MTAPAFGATVATVLLPVVLMMAKAIVDIFVDDPEQRVQQVFDVIGNPFVALLIAVVVAMFTLGRALGHGPRRHHQDRGVLAAGRSPASC